MVRSLYASYAGPLYQVVRSADRQTMNVSTLGPGGFADAAAQTAFCSAETPIPPSPGPPAPLWAPGPCCDVFRASSCPNHCDQQSPGACPPDPGCIGCASCGTPSSAPALAACVITRIFDQSGNGNHVHVVGHPDGREPVASGGRLSSGGAPTTGTNASADPLFVGGHAVYSAYFEGGMGFRANGTAAVPAGDEAETIYMVASGTHYGSACCFDYGNAEIGTWPNTTNNLTYARGLMEAVYVRPLLDTNSLVISRSSFTDFITHSSSTCCNTPGISARATAWTGRT